MNRSFLRPGAGLVLALTGILVLGCGAAKEPAVFAPFLPEAPANWQSSKRSEEKTPEGGRHAWADYQPSPESEAAKSIEKVQVTISYIPKEMPQDRQREVRRFPKREGGEFMEQITVGGVNALASSPFSKHKEHVLSIFPGACIVDIVVFAKEKSPEEELELWGPDRQTALLFADKIDLKELKEWKPPEAPAGKDPKADKPAAPPSPSQVKIGMTSGEVEELLGKGQAAARPEGQGMPISVLIEKEGKVQSIAHTYRQWKMGEKTVVIAFFEGRVGRKQDGSPAVVELDAQAKPQKTLEGPKGPPVHDFVCWASLHLVCKNRSVAPYHF